MSKLLYYPTISIPDSSWLPKALLYWDGLATIAPEEYLKDPFQFSPFMQSLLQEELIEIVQPEKYTYTHDEDFNLFLNWAADNADYFAPRTYKWSKTTPISFTNLHWSKMSDYFRDRLLDAGLAFNFKRRWVRVSPEFGQAFMTFLAILIGQETDMAPVTDRLPGISSLFYRDRPSDSDIVRNTLRNSILDDILPVPEGLHGIEGLQKVRQFKERYHDELERFRCHIEEFILSVDGQSEDVQDKRREIFLRNAQDEIDEIKGHMGWFQAPQINMGTFIAALPSAIEFFNQNIRGASIGLATVLGQTIYNAERNHYRRKPLAYAALYQHKYGR